MTSLYVRSTWTVGVARAEQSARPFGGPAPIRQTHDRASAGRCADRPGGRQKCAASQRGHRQQSSLAADLTGRDVVDAVDLTALDGGHQRRWLDDEPDEYLVEVGQLVAAVGVPVIGVLLEQDVVAF